MRVLVAGGTGFLGRRVVHRLVARGDEVTVLSRQPSARGGFTPEVKVALWDPTRADLGGDAPRLVDEQDAVVNLAGEGVADERWTAARKAVLRSSRIDTTAALARAVAARPAGPPVLITASAVGIYGTHADTSPEVARREGAEIAPGGGGNVGGDFLADLCVDWERAADPARERGGRVVHLRFGVVFGPEGGALAKMVPPFRLFVGGPLGGGRQIMSWVHQDDGAEAVLHALDESSMAGPCNVTSPNPATMDDVAAALGKVLHRPSAARVPAAALRLALGERADVVLGGQRAFPERLLATGFEFHFPELLGALQDLLAPA